MSHTIAASSTGPAGHAPPTAHCRARAAFAAEWIKLRSLRSMLVTPLLTAVVCIGLADLVCSNYAANWPRFDAARKAGFVPLDTNLRFVVIGAIFLGVLGALVVTNEYGHGLIRTTLAGTPQRGLVLAAKAVLLGLVAFAVSAVICFTAFFTGQGSAAAAICSVFALLFVLPALASGLPDDLAKRDIVPYLPTSLGGSLYLSHPAHTVGIARTGAAVLATAAWVLVLGVAAAFVLRGHDA